MKPINPYIQYIAPEIAAALIAGGVSLVGSGASTGATLGSAGKINKKTRKWYEKMYKTQVENNREDATTAYTRQKELSALNVENANKLEKESWNAKLSGIHEAGLNPGLALNGAGTVGAGGIATPVEKASPAQVGNPNGFSGNLPNIGEAAVQASQAALNYAEARKIEGVTEPEQKKMQSLEEDIKKTTAEVENIKKTTKFLETQVTFQTLQNDIAEATKGMQIDTFQWNLNKLKQDYRYGIESIKRLRIENQYQNKYWNAMINNLDANTTKLFWNAKLDKQTFGQNKINFPNIFNKAKAEAKNEAELRERFEQQVKTDILGIKTKENTEERGQNMEVINRAISTVTQIAWMLFMVRGKGFGKLPKTPAGRNVKSDSQTFEWSNGKWQPKTRKILM